MSDEPKRKPLSWMPIATAVVAGYVISGITLMTLAGIGWLNPTVGRALLPILSPFLWVAWTCPGLRDVSDTYIKWLQSLR
jgi:hypothetical protein